MSFKKNLSPLIKPPTKWGFGLDAQSLIKTFFSLNATITIAALLMIMGSLLKEGAGFFGTYRAELERYRLSGQEYVDLVLLPIKRYEDQFSDLNQALNAQVDQIAGTAKQQRNEVLTYKSRVESLSKNARDRVRNLARQEPIDEATLKAAIITYQDQLRLHFDKVELPTTLSQEQLQAFQQELLTHTPDQSGQGPILKNYIAEAARLEKLAKTQFAELTSVVSELQSLGNALSQHSMHLKELALATTDNATKVQSLKALEPQTLTHIETFRENWQASLSKLPQDIEQPDAKEKLKNYAEKAEAQIQKLSLLPEHIQQWTPDKPVRFIHSLGSFFFGVHWITNSSWRDIYGLLPLLSGSLIIALIAMCIALPVSVAAAIYVNQFASKREQAWLKPSIEFIQAIPSVVLGFIGIAILGDLLKDFSNLPFVQWIPGFPIQERLNMFNAGCLLAFMAIPTIFSLAEDAINNVPKAFSEASEALGATHLQTVFRVIVPASLSGIFAAVLLGLGRILGETMVVLLVAGNRLNIPNFEQGIGSVFQPAHTLTGIIAQELGEVSQGSLHWQALFNVGILLFIISLIINWSARLILRRYQLPKL